MGNCKYCTPSALTVSGEYKGLFSATHVLMAAMLPPQRIRKKKGKGKGGKESVPLRSALCISQQYFHYIIPPIPSCFAPQYSNFSSLLSLSKFSNSLRKG
ncbi:hypothetical protein NL676_029042 [Syzygium grande]|nr:hypothetical protein NL676_029042 [Syzygium grande]